MHPLFNISSVSLLAGLLFLLQASFNHAWGSSKPPASPQEPQTFILPLYLKSTPLSEKRQVFRKSLSAFPFAKKNPRIHQFVREYPALTFDEGVSLFVQRTAMGQTPGDVCARLNELTALMQHKNMQSGQRRSCLTGFFGKCLSPDVLPLGYGSFIALRPDGTGNGGRMPIDPSVSYFKNLGKRSYIHGKRNRHAKKTGSSFYL
ncbi:hypothetical protein M5E88_19580 [Akkermansia muciniphila]|nr:hypothetical protein M5E88_19580 [Akkermansia muciniphila]